MSCFRTFALVLCSLSILVAGCGSGDSPKSATDSKDAKDATTESAPDPGTEEAIEAKSTIDVFAETPAIRSCMEDAGFARDAPTTGAVAAWRHADGSRVVVGSEEGVTSGIAAEIGTAERPASVDGVRVIAATPELEQAAAACLDA